MNYALDALWWRLADPRVRDLAAVLTAPAPWRSGCEIPVRTLLGAHGFRYLLALDDNPAPLAAHLADETPHGGRLGRYAESLLAFWLEHAPHSRLIARNVLVADGADTLGEMDFTAEIDGRLYHIELACKYYGAADGSPERLAGLNPCDRLRDKAAKLQKQLARAQDGAGRQALAAAGAAGVPQSGSVLRGILFAAQGTVWQPPLNPTGWHGLYFDEWPSETPFSDGLRYACLPRLSYLAPARLPEAQTREWAQIRMQEHGLFAALERRPDGFWHETGRMMKRGVQAAA
ncbi:Domain of uncharacterised function (DUF1853) [Kingella potus]|uniref:Domain of uncharacterized function (DUF1853) n=1 Tax=Kingella potus TaxID=265175 RepID=A0A377QX79_9NEIS|nr:DUF1853 family protein [Kingella potus]UOP01685.1 DUF1853 family protein [Kingella potus]STR00014.1 Domain of uncharacterised function (DUF1853) [Kingella potus]